jgi:hypothetical protein
VFQSSWVGEENVLVLVPFVLGESDADFEARRDQAREALRGD